MMYKTAKIPTLVGLFLLLVGVGAGVLLIRQEAIFNPSAAPSETPQDVRITNIGDRGFSISWITSGKTGGFISWGKNTSVGTVATSTTDTNSYVHQVNVANLNPETTYYFKIGVGKFDVTKSKLYSAKTGASLKNPPVPDIIFGAVVDDQNKPVTGAVLYHTVAGVAPLSVVTDSKGKWSLNLAEARATNLKQAATYDKNETLLEIFVQAGNERFSSAKIKTGAAHPVPVLTLGKTHDFTNLKPITDGQVPEASLDLTIPSFPVGGPLGASPTPSPSPVSRFSTKPLTQGPSSPVGGPLGASPTPSPSPKNVAAAGTQATSTVVHDVLPSAGNLTVTLFVFVMGLILVVIGVFVPQTA